MFFLTRVASALVFLTGLALLRLAVVLESWPALVAGLGIATAGLVWFVLGGSPPSSDRWHSAPSQSR